MKINLITKPNNRLISCGAIYVPDDNLRGSIVNSLNDSQVEKLDEIIVSQRDNPVNVWISANKYDLLEAKFACPIRLRNFKEFRMQIPFFETKFHFFKRMSKIANEYKKQLEI